MVPEKIDLVYTWVNDKDPAWREKKSKFDSEAFSCDKDANSSYRYFNNDELKYSLRSVQKNIPWINKIFIITDNQKPEWLNLNNEKIRVVDHKEILPAEILPTYNACTIENAIPNIKELSEYFIYANDDMFFWNEAAPEFFFDDEKPVYRVDKRLYPNKKYKHLYGSMVYMAYSLVKERFGVSFPYFSHHNADAYKKSLFLECMEEFKKEADVTSKNRFRKSNDLQRMIVTYYSLYKKAAVLKKVGICPIKRFFGLIPDSEYFDMRPSNVNKIANSKAKLMCINDSRKSTDAARTKIKEILETKFPEKSEFEV